VTEAIGYRVDHSWVAMPGAVDDSGRLRQVRGVTPAPGLYTLGLPWQHTRGSALLGWVGADAEFIAAHIAATPPALSSQSSGCAPKQMMCSFASSAAITEAGRRKENANAARVLMLDAL